ncbi:MAG: thiamine biosynthesis protein [Desulfocapsaceae bacterium]|nr:thiamine biosynthesis protein [Desulfocapsaceae bacterium]
MVSALGLFSGGLDSILACRLVAAQGIAVKAIKFVTPFFGYEVLADPDQYRQEMLQKYGIDVIVKDVSVEYLHLLRNPAHGFGKNFNPCIDCKIFMFSRAREMMTALGASFLITGEVVGQRPMSQRRDTLNVIERDSGSRSILLRPLSAKLMRETEAELKGLVDRERLLDFSGRGRSRQIALAREMGITDFPAPAGGCILADPILSRRVARIYTGDFFIPLEDVSPLDVMLFLVGRQFRLPGGGWLIVGRDEQENQRLAGLCGESDLLLAMQSRPGPTAVLRRPASLCADRLTDDLQIAAALVVRYGKKIPAGSRRSEVVILSAAGKKILMVDPLPENMLSALQQSYS